VGYGESGSDTTDIINLKKKKHSREEVCGWGLFSTLLLKITLAFIAIHFITELTNK
jgi:hypothetical protein